MAERDLRCTDRLTLEHLRKSLPADILEEADREGIFDLLKARRGKGDLHPETVTVHTKHGTYEAVRLKRNGVDPERTRDPQKQRGTRRGRGKKKSKDRARPAHDTKNRQERLSRETRRLLASLSSVLGDDSKTHNVIERRKWRPIVDRFNSSVLRHKAKGVIRDDLQARSTWNAKRIPKWETIRARWRLCNLHGKDDIDYIHNCVNCVLAYEARSRLIAVRAGKAIPEGDSRSRTIDYCFVGKPPLIELNARSPEAIVRDVVELMAYWGDGARAFIMVGYNKTPGQEKQSHVFVAEQNNGKTYFVEPQKSDLDPNSEGVFHCLKNTGAAFLMRVDNLQFSDYAKDRLEHEDGRPLR